MRLSCVSGKGALWSAVVKRRAGRMGWGGYWARHLVRGYCCVNDNDTGFGADHAHVTCRGYCGVVMIACDDHCPDATSAEERNEGIRLGLKRSSRCTQHMHSCKHRTNRTQQTRRHKVVRQLGTQAIGGFSTS